MNNFEPTFLGITVFIISIVEINLVLQGLLLIATLVYTILKIKQLLSKKGNILAMKNLIRQIFLAVGLVWMTLSYSCSTLHVKLQEYHSGLIQDSELQSIIKKWEAQKTRRISEDSLQIYMPYLLPKDSVFYQHLYRLDSLE